MLIQRKNKLVPQIKISYPKCELVYKIKSIQDAVDVFRECWDNNLINVQEEFSVILLNQLDEVLGFRKLHTGSISSSHVDLTLLFSLACKSLSSSIIIAHNHPSGSIKPSADDIRLTRNVKNAAEIIGIKLLDHIILTESDFYSFKQSNKL